MILIAAISLSPFLLGIAERLGACVEKALIIASANMSTATGFSLFIALGAPCMDKYSDAAVRRIAPASRLLILERRDKRVREALRRRPGLLAFPLALLILSSSMMAAGFSSITPYLAILLSPHTYLELLGLYAALRGGVASYIRGSREALILGLLVSVALFLAGGFIEVYVFPRIYNAVT